MLVESNITTDFNELQSFPKEKKLKRNNRTDCFLFIEEIQILVVRSRRYILRNQFLADDSTKELFKVSRQKKNYSRLFVKPSSYHKSFWRFPEPKIFFKVFYIYILLLFYKKSSPLWCSWFLNSEHHKEGLHTGKQKLVKIMHGVRVKENDKDEYLIINNWLTSWVKFLGITFPSILMPWHCKKKMQKKNNL